MTRALWIVVADAAEAIIYEREGLKETKQVMRLRHAEAHLRDRDLRTDRPGRGSNDAGGSWSLAQTTSATEHELDRFARVIAAEVESAHIAHRFSEVALVMQPRLLGLVRSHLSSRTMDIVVATIDRRLNEAPMAEVASIVAEARASTAP